MVFRAVGLVFKAHVLWLTLNLSHSIWIFYFACYRSQLYCVGSKYSSTRGRQNRVVYETGKYLLKIAKSPCSFLFFFFVRVASVKPKHLDSFYCYPTGEGRAIFRPYILCRSASKDYGLRIFVTPWILSEKCVEYSWFCRGCYWVSACICFVLLLALCTRSSCLFVALNRNVKVICFYWLFI